MIIRLIVLLTVLSMAAPVFAQVGITPTGGGGVTAGSSATSTPSSYNSDATGFGKAWYAGATNFPELPVSQSVYPAMYYVDDNTLIGARFETAGGWSVWTSVDGGYSFTKAPASGSFPGGGLTSKFISARTLGMTRASNGNFVVGYVTGGADPTISYSASVLTGWKSATSGVPIGIDSTAMSRARGNTIILAMTGSPAQLCRTGDGGPTWVCSTPASNTGFTTVNSIDSPTTNIWLAQDAAGRVYRSTDDGLSFTLITTLTTTGSPAAGGHPLACLSASVCVANAGTAIYRSTDAGLTWALQFDPGVVNAGDANIKALVVFDSNTVAQIGNFTALAGWYRSSDGGVSWVQETHTISLASGVDHDVQLYTSRSTGAAAVVPMMTAGAYTSTCDDQRNPPTGTTAYDCSFYTRASRANATILSDGNSAIGIGTRPLVTTSIQGDQVLNQQSTGGAATAVTLTLAAQVGRKNHVYKVTGRCNGAGTSSLTITDAGTAVWSTGGAEVPTGTVNFEKQWYPGLTSIASNTAMVITLASCGGAVTGTLSIQADTF